MPNRHQTVTCTTMPQFLAVIAGLVREGLTFDANAEALTINLTGGY